MVLRFVGWGPYNSYDIDGGLLVVPYSVTPMRPSFPLTLDGILALVVGSAAPVQVQTPDGRRLYDDDGQLERDPVRGGAAAPFALHGAPSAVTGAWLGTHPGGLSLVLRGMVNGQAEVTMLGRGACVHMPNLPTGDGIEDQVELDVVRREWRFQTRADKAVTVVLVAEAPDGSFRAVRQGSFSTSGERPSEPAPLGKLPNAACPTRRTVEPWRTAKHPIRRPCRLVRLLLTYPRMAPHPVDTLMARAQTHLVGARYPQAIGAFRAAVAVAVAGLAVAGPKVVHAQLGLADALSAMGRRSEAVDGLVGAAEAFTGRDEYDAAIDLLGRALALDPARMELHLDLAMVEEAMGRHDAAVTRLEGLADRYMDTGRFEDAAELLQLLSAWDEGNHAESPVPVAAVPAAAPVATAPEVFPRNTALITGATVIARNPLLPALATQPPVLEPAALVRDDEVTRARVALVVVPRAAVRPVPHTPAEPRDAALVQRLRARAGLRPAGVVSRPAAIRNTEPIAIRRSLDRSPVQDDDVTRYFRRPRGLAAAS